VSRRRREGREVGKKRLGRRGEESARGGRDWDGEVVGGRKGLL
jgi:hypothetical protein